MVEAGDLSRAVHGDLYEVMCDLADAEQPVDPVTVSWAASQRGIEADAADLAGGIGAFAVASAREVHWRGLLTQIGRAGRDIQARAGDGRSVPWLVLCSAGEWLHRIELDRGAWQPAGCAVGAGMGAG